MHMSWDVSLIKECKCCGHKDEIDVGNYTYNVSPMYKKAMGCSISEFNGKLAKEVLDILSQGIYNMTNEPEVYKLMNPKNGYGNYEGALRFLQEIHDVCKENQDYIIEVS